MFLGEKKGVTKKVFLLQVSLITFRLPSFSRRDRRLLKSMSQTQDKNERKERGANMFKSSERTMAITLKRGKKSIKRKKNEGYTKEIVRGEGYKTEKSKE